MIGRANPAMQTDHSLLTGDEEHAALLACCEPGTALCTIVGIDGSFSRRLGAQLAIGPDGALSGSLADGCLEQQLARDARDCAAPVVKRYGRGSPQIDFRLPCGGGLDILIDPAPDSMACRDAVQRLQDRQVAVLRLAANSFMQQRRYIPALQLRVFGEGPELAALQRLARAAGIAVETFDPDSLSLGQMPALDAADAWTAVVLLFHDHEWETPLLMHSLDSRAFYIGAQGGENARISRTAQLLAAGAREEDVARIRGPIGTIAACRTPTALALSILGEIAGKYEALQPAQ